jgi:hypothetical protein
VRINDRKSARVDIIFQPEPDARYKHDKANPCDDQVLARAVNSDCEK